MPAGAVSGKHPSKDRSGLLDTYRFRHREVPPSVQLSIMHPASGDAMKQSGLSPYSCTSHARITAIILVENGFQFSNGLLSRAFSHVTLIVTD